MNDPPIDLGPLDYEVPSADPRRAVVRLMGIAVAAQAVTHVLLIFTRFGSGIFNYVWAHPAMVPAFWIDVVHLPVDFALLASAMLILRSTPAGRVYVLVLEPVVVFLGLARAAASVLQAARAGTINGSYTAMQVATALSIAVLPALIWMLFRQLETRSPD